MQKIKRLCYNRTMKKSCGGFTLIELSLSLIFIAILSLAVVFLIQNLSASYRRGIILNQVNTVGMDLVDEFRRSIQNASSDPITMTCEIYYGVDVNNANRRACIEDKAYSFVSVTKTARVTVTDNGRTVLNKDMPVFGALCTGTYTYIWNTGYFENPETGTDKRTVTGASAAVVGTKASITAPFNQKYAGFRVLKIYDDERSVCVNAMENQTGRDASTQYLKRGSYQNNRVSNQFVIDTAMLNDANGEAVEVMKTDKSADLVLYELYVAQPALSSTRQNLFYAASFILGTRRGGVNITQAGNSCKPPSDDYSELEYCAINKFNFAVMAGGA